MKRFGRPAAAAVLALLALPEAVFWLSSRGLRGHPREGSCAVLVLGYPQRPDGSAHPVQRWRVAAGAELFSRESCRLMVLSGGAPKTRRPEAEVMAELAAAAGVPSRLMAQERAATNTWENARLSAPLLGRFERVFVVSDPLHARRGRRYFCRQDPGFCPRVHPWAPYRFLEAYGRKWFVLVYETGALLRDAWKHGLFVYNPP